MGCIGSSTSTCDTGGFFFDLLDDLAAAAGVFELDAAGALRFLADDLVARFFFAEAVASAASYRSVFVRLRDERLAPPPLALAASDDLSDGAPSRDLCPSNSPLG